MSKTIIIGVNPNLSERQTNLLRQQLEQYTDGYNLVLASGVVGGIVLEGKEYETKVSKPNNRK